MQAPAIMPLTGRNQVQWPRPSEKMPVIAAPISIAIVNDRTMPTQSCRKRRAGIGSMVRQPTGNGFVNAGARAAAFRMAATRRALSSRMRKSLILLILCVASNLLAQMPQPTDDKNNRANLTIALEALGDNSEGVVCRTTFRY